LEGKWDVKGIVEKRRGTLPGVGHNEGNEILWGGNATRIDAIDISYFA
jgi:hypothetical protein